MVETLQKDDGYLIKVLWNKPDYDSHLKTKMSVGTDNFNYELRGLPSKIGLPEVFEFVSSIKTMHSLDEKIAQGIISASEELIENAFKHSYKRSDVDEYGNLNEITLGVSVYKTHVHAYCITKNASTDLEAISRRLSQKVSKERIEENDALRPGDGGRGFLLTKLLTDMIYVQQDAAGTEFGFLKILPH